MPVGRRGNAGLRSLLDHAHREKEYSPPCTVIPVCGTVGRMHARVSASRTRHDNSVFHPPMHPAFTAMLCDPQYPRRQTCTCKDADHIQSAPHWTIANVAHAPYKPFCPRQIEPEKDAKETAEQNGSQNIALNLPCRHVCAPHWPQRMSREARRKECREKHAGGTEAN